MNPKQVGLFGYSEGGIIATMLAAQLRRRVCDLMAPPAVNGYDFLVKQCNEWL